MNKNRFVSNKSAYFAAVIFVASISTAFLLFQTGCGESANRSIAKLLQPQGKVEVKPESDAPFAAAKADVVLQIGGAVRTGEDGRCLIEYANGINIALNTDTYYEIKGQTAAGRQESGSAIYRVQPQKSQVSIETPNGVTTVLGTTFRIDVASNQTSITLKEGAIKFTSVSKESVELAPGQQLVAKSNEPLTQPVSVDPITLESLFNPESKLPEINRR